MATNYIILLVSKLDSQVKKEIIYVVGGAALGFVTGKVVEIVVTKTLGNKLKDTSKPTEEPTLPKTKSKRFFLKVNRGGDLLALGATLLNLIRAGNDIYTFAGMIGGFGYYLKTLDEAQLVGFIQNATLEKVRQLAVPSTAAVAVVDTLKDVSCPLTFDMIVRILLDKDLPFSKKEEELNRVFSELDFNKMKDKAIFLVCLSNLLILLYYTSRMGGYFLLLGKLKALFRAGKLSKVLYYFILRNLRKRGIPVSSDIKRLLEELEE
jgi:hypothetical protein